MKVDLRRHAPRHPVEVGQVYERVAVLLRDGTRWGHKYLGRERHGWTRIRIVQVPDGRCRTYRFVKVDPRTGGNGRPDRGSHPITLRALAHHYRLDLGLGTEGNDG